MNQNRYKHISTGIQHIPKESINLHLNYNTTNTDHPLTKANLLIAKYNADKPYNI